MIALLLVAIPFVGGLAAWAAGRRSGSAARWISAAALGLDLVLAVGLWLGLVAGANVGARAGGAASRLSEFDVTWIARFGIRFHVAVDGLSLVLVALTLFLGFLAVLISWRGITSRVGFFHFNLLWVLAGIAGVFTAVDLFVFYFFWELMLVPMYFLIGIWGHEKRVAASFKFFIFTQAGGLAMLVSILALHFIHGKATGVYTFDYPELLTTPLGPAAGLWVTLGFALAFAVKLPALPFHTWLPDAHAEAPTAGSIILAGLLLKTGAYGFLRFVLPLSPSAPPAFRTVMMGLGVAGILYGAQLAFAQTDVKRLVAYTSVSHMGFILLGVFSGNAIALRGVVLQIVCHGVSTGALFVVAGALQDRLHTRDMTKMGGLWAVMPRLGAAGLLFALAALGLPGLGNFVAEFLVLAGAFGPAPVLTIIGALGFIASTIYALSFVQRVFHGPVDENRLAPDLGPRELAVFGLLAAAIIWLGVYPQPVLDRVRSPLETMGTAAYDNRAPSAPPAETAGRGRAVAWSGRGGHAPREERRTDATAERPGALPAKGIDIEGAGPPMPPGRSVRKGGAP